MAHVVNLGERRWISWRYRHGKASQDGNLPNKRINLTRFARRLSVNR